MLVLIVSDEDVSYLTRPVTGAPAVSSPVALASEVSVADLHINVSTGDWADSLSDASVLDAIVVDGITACVVRRASKSSEELSGRSISNLEVEIGRSDEVSS